MILKLDFSSDIPIYTQIRNQVVCAIADGILREGERLPTVRALAQEAGINTMTVNKAYQQLKQEGYIITDRRNGATVKCILKDGDIIKRDISDKLEVIIAEAKAGGLSMDEVIKLCELLYNGEKEE